MAITQKLVREVKLSNKKNWHDKDWWTFQNKKEVEAINYALSAKNAGDTPAEIVAEAKKMLAFMNKNKK